MKISLKKCVIWQVVGTALVSGILLGCNSAPGTGNGTTLNDHYFRGSIVVDPNHDSTFVNAIVRRDGMLASGATVVVRNDTLAYSPSLYPTDSSWFFSDDTARHFPLGSLTVTTTDGSIIRSFAQNLPDTFSITSVAPFNRLIQGNGSATIEWGGKSGYTSFAVAVVKSDSAYIGKGWSSYSQTFVTASTIPPDAFLGSDGSTPVPGLYNLYVYGIVGSPDSAIASQLLPVDLPTQLNDNIDQHLFKGHFGVVSIALMDTIRVVQQP